MKLRDWHGTVIVRVITIDIEYRVIFERWLSGQKRPYVCGDDNPWGWAYFDDFIRCFKIR